MPVLSLACHLPHNTPHIPSRYNNEQTTKETKAINNSYIYIYINISCKCDTNRAGHFTLDAYASRPVACFLTDANKSEPLDNYIWYRYHRYQCNQSLCAFVVLKALNNYQHTAAYYKTILKEPADCKNTTHPITCILMPHIDNKTRLMIHVITKVNFYSTFKPCMEHCNSRLLYSPRPLYSTKAHLVHF